ncbi:MAG: FAD-dependent oxidoreductase, partial [Pseudomonadota bacterium]
MGRAAFLPGRRRACGAASDPTKVASGTKVSGALQLAHWTAGRWAGDEDNGMAAGSTYERADCLVLGAGIVGVSTALALQAAGRDVILVDRKQPGSGTSFGNAGIIQGEGVTPYMLPRNIATLTAMALNRRPEAHLHYRSVLALLPWLARYFWNSSERRFHAIASANAPLIARCVET